MYGEAARSGDKKALKKFKYENWEWDEVVDYYEECKKCRLWAGRTNSVFGSGSKKAKVLIIGEGPGETEDKDGVPFVGRSGKLLREYLKKAGLIKKDVYITNLVACRPPKNRDPDYSEVKACEPRVKYIVRHLPNLKVIVCVGGSAIYFVLGLQSVRQSMAIHYPSEKQYGINIMVYGVYHPAYLLRRGKPKKAMKEWLTCFREIKENADGDNSDK